MLNKIETKNGYVFATKDRKQVYGSVLYLGIYDSPDNYVEITTQEAEELKIQIQKEQEELMKQSLELEEDKEE